MLLSELFHDDLDEAKIADYAKGALAAGGLMAAAGNAYVSRNATNDSVDPIEWSAGSDTPLDDATAYDDPDTDDGFGPIVPVVEPHHTHPHGHHAPKPSHKTARHAHNQKLPEAIKYMALTMWGEARSEGVRGMEAVGNVILNRMHSHRHFGKTVKEVVLKRKAFSCWNKGDPNRQRMLDIKHLARDSIEYKKWLEAVKIAKRIYYKHPTDITKGALFYHTKNIMPTWAMGIKPISAVVNHVFYDMDHKA